MGCHFDLYASFGMRYIETKGSEYIFRLSGIKNMGIGLMIPAKQKSRK